MGHADLATTQRYLHLTPTHMEAAIRRLEDGDILETGTRMSLAENGGPRKNPASGTTETGRCW